MASLLASTFTGRFLADITICQGCPEKEIIINLVQGWVVFGSVLWIHSAEILPQSVKFKCHATNIKNKNKNKKTNKNKNKKTNKNKNKNKNKTKQNKTKQKTKTKQNKTKTKKKQKTKINQKNKNKQTNKKKTTWDETSFAVVCGAFRCLFFFFFF